MSTHISAQVGDIASIVLFPGDPLRAQSIANKHLTDVTRYNTTRNMFGFTGLTKTGERVSVQGSGMGMPSLSIYAHELIDEYDVTDIIRVGSCGALQGRIKTRDIILAQGACSDSNINRRRFKQLDFAPVANWGLLYKAFNAAGDLGIPVLVGNILSADLFYNGHDEDEWKMWADAGVLAVEMESAELYTIGALKGVRTLSILTVSDSIPNEKYLSAEERETSFDDMIRIALAI